MTSADILTSSMRSPPTTDERASHQHVSTDGITIRFKILPFQTSEQSTSSTRRRKVEVAHGDRSAGATEKTSNSSQDIIQEHPHQDPVSSGILPATATSAKDSLEISQRPQWRESCVAYSQHPTLPLSQRQTIALSQHSKQSKTREHDCLLPGRVCKPTGLGRDNLGRVSQQKTVPPEGLSRLADELAKLKAPEEYCQDVLGLVHALLPAVECDCAAGSC
ncbi:hypothetical protein CERZMDRAFT_86934 [Cercospora zeae-maydis SCOH1-5]|uniref:Uncharacterized protein n=1 Tax=Cercospora zeae-maydis SCOH1-5 TaxID=717836 RepID=A0A6A6F740_9PEZI|nr:hypothetical protein CERZMDRAFT_86934 [Cercospora zeae-maydis SCOH1-5]